MVNPQLPTIEDILKALANVVDPELGADIVSLGMVGEPSIDSDGNVNAPIALTIAKCPLRSQIESEATARIASLPGVSNVTITITAMDADQREALMMRARKISQTDSPPTSVGLTTRILSIASGKGGVGKSTVTTNLATQLALDGFKVGVLDADIWGFSIPRMLGVDANITAKANEDGVVQMQPVAATFTAPDGHVVQLKTISMGFLAEENSAIMWRGLMLSRALQHFLEEVNWGELDYLLIDMPPGTGDIQLALAQLLPRAEMILITTPALAAQNVASRVADMARKSHLRVVGVVENMSPATDEHGNSVAYFGSGGGQRLADEIGAPLITQIELDEEMSSFSDTGKPLVVGNPESTAAKQIQLLAKRLSSELAPPLNMDTCTSRMLKSLENVGVSISDGKTV